MVFVGMEFAFNSKALVLTPGRKGAGTQSLFCFSVHLHERPRQQGLEQRLGLPLGFDLLRAQALEAPHDPGETLLEGEWGNQNP